MLESVAGGVKSFFNHWAGAGIVAIAGFAVSVSITGAFLMEPLNNENIAQEQMFLDEFHQNMNDITVLRKSMVVADKTKDLDEYTNGTWDIGSEKWGNYTLAKLRGVEQIEQKTDNMIVDILMDTDLPETTFSKISQEMGKVELQTYNIDMSKISSWAFRESQNDILNSKGANELSDIEKAQEIKEETKSEADTDMVLFFLMFASLSYLGATSVAPAISRTAGKAEKELKKLNNKNSRKQN